MILRVYFPGGIADEGPNLTVDQRAMDLNERAILLARSAVAGGLSGLGVGAA
jgi:hypothetical protein